MPKSWKHHIISLIYLKIQDINDNQAPNQGQMYMQ